jgi:hypothetical protein
MSLGGCDRTLAPALVKARPRTRACGDPSPPHPYIPASLHPHIVSSELQPPGQSTRKYIKGVIQTPSNRTETSREQSESKHSGKEVGAGTTGTECARTHKHAKQACLTSSTRHSHTPRATVPPYDTWRPRSHLRASLGQGTPQNVGMWLPTFFFQKKINFRRRSEPGWPRSQTQIWVFRSNMCFFRESHLGSCDKNYHEPNQINRPF